MRTDTHEGDTLDGFYEENDDNCLDDLQILNEINEMIGVEVDRW